MAVLMEERRKALEARKSLIEAAESPRHEGGGYPSLLTWLTTVGKFLLGLVLSLVGLLVRAVLAVSLLAAPFIALILAVFLAALLVEGTGFLLRAVGLSH